MTDEDKKELSYELYQMRDGYSSEDFQMSSLKRCVEMLAKALGVEPWDPRAEFGRPSK